MLVTRRFPFNMPVLLVLAEGLFFFVVSFSSNVINADDVEELHPAMLKSHGEISRANIFKRNAMRFGNYSNYFQGQDLSACTTCGLINSRQGTDLIIKGDIVDPPNKYPWMVYLKIKEKNDARSACGGSIINAYYILTAAHCLIDLAGPEGLTILFMANGNSYVRGPEVQEVIMHPEYTHSVLKNDIALVKLKKKIICDRFKNPICLPSPDMKKAEGKVLTASGWGATKPGGQGYPQELREGKIKIVNYSICANYFRGSTYHTQDIKYCCDGLEGNWQSICYGDSGGPAFYERDGKNYVIGVSSSVSKKCPLGKPFMLTAVPSYLNWIKSVIQ